MSHDSTPSPQDTELRQAAEGSAGEIPPISEVPLESLHLRAIREMTHELQAHKVELEMQNEELRRAQSDLEESRDRYFDLYDLAPIGYATLNSEYVILEANLAVADLLGMPRSALVSSPISRFVTPDHLDILYLHQKGVRNEGDSHDCEIEMIRGDGSPVWVHLQCTMSRDLDGTPLCCSIMKDISRRIKVQQTLEASLAFSSELIGSMQDGFSVIDSKGVTVDANPAICRITGFSKEELVGIGPPHPYWPPEEIPKITEALKTTLGAGAVDFELIFMRKNGERFPVLVSAFPVPDENGNVVRFAASVKDITLRKQAEAALLNWNHTLERKVNERTEELKRSESRFRQLTETTFEGIAISENGILIDGNPQVAAMLQYDLAEVIGRPVTDFVDPDSVNLVIDRMQSGSEDSYECLGVRKDGTRIPLEVKGRLMDWQGKPTRVSALRDLTSVKRAEAKHLARKEETDKVMKLALVSEISAGIIHQISQPLTSIGANLAAIMGSKMCESDPSGCANILEKIDSDMKRIRESVIHLRALSNIEQPKLVPVDLNAMVSEALLAIKAEAVMKDVIIQVHRASEVAKVKADEIQLSHAMINLVRNAIDACADLPRDRRAIDISTRVIPEEKFELCVRDSGTGIPPDVKERMFSPFFTTKADGLGIGIGLRLTQTIVQAHNGTITGFNNPEGSGATFRVVLPLDSGEIYTKG